MPLVNIYKITNLSTGKLYIGQTRNSIEKRYAQHWQRALYQAQRTQPLYLSMRKRGKENFILELIEQVDSQEEADSKEINYIKDYNTQVPNGYNIAIGGSVNSQISEYTRKKMSIARIGKKPTETTKRRQSASAYARYSKDPELVNRHALKVRLTGQKLVAVNSNHTLFFTSVGFAKDAGFDTSHIRKCVKGKLKTHKKYAWYRLEDFLCL